MSSTEIPLAPYRVSFFHILAAFLALLAVVLVVVFLYFAIGLNGLSLSVDKGDVTINGILYGQTIPHKSLQVDKAKVVNLNTTEGFAPKRDSGVGFSNLQYGWFHLKNGEKALLLVSDPTKAVYVPTTEGYALVVSPSDPDGFLKALKK